MQIGQRWVDVVVGLWMIRGSARGMIVGVLSALGGDSVEFRSGGRLPVRIN